MRIIQSYNTFEGYKTTGGFSTPVGLKNYLKKSYKIHKDLTDDFIMYTDERGYEIIKEIYETKHIKIIEFPNILMGKLVYEGKFYTQSLQNKPYIHVDLDATLNNFPLISDVYLEKIRPMLFLGREATNLNIEHMGIFQIPCSAIIGFSDMEFQKKYLKEVYSRFDIIKKIPKCTYEYAYTLEEVLLQRLIVDNNKSHMVCDCEHLGHMK